MLGRNAEYPDNIDASTSVSLVLVGEEMAGTTEYAARLIMLAGCSYNSEEASNTTQEVETTTEAETEAESSSTAAEEMPSEEASA